MTGFLYREIGDAVAMDVALFWYLTLQRNAAG